MTMQNPDDLVRADEEQRRRREADAARRAAGSSLYAARGWNPEAVAEEQRTAERLGIAPILVEADPAGARQRAQSQADLILLHDAPATARWLSQPDNARVAHDQVESLTLMERLAGTLAGSPLGIGDRARGVGMLSGVGDLGRRGIGGAIGAVGYALEGASALYNMIPNERVDQRLGRASLSYLADRVRLGARTIEGNLTPVEEAQIAALGLTPRIAPAQTDTGFAGYVASGVGQIGGQLTMIAATGGTAMLPSLFLQGAGQMGQRVDEDMTAEGRDGYSMSDRAAIIGGGLITAASEKFGLSAVLGRLPAPIRARLTNKVADVIAAGGAEAISEVVEGVGHNALAGALLGDEGGLLDGTVEEGSVAAVVGSLVRALTLTAIPGRQYVESQDKAREAEARLQSFDQLGERVLENPLFKRSPDRMQAFLESVNPEAMVHLPAEVVATFFQSNPDLDSWVDEWDIRDQLEQAHAGGAEVVIPASVYLTRIRPTEAHEAFKADLRMGFDDLSEREVADQAENGEARLDEAMTEAETVADEAEAGAAPFDRVVSDVFSQLRAAGRSIDVARREALVEGVRARTRAARSPEAYADAWEAYQAEPLTIQRGEVAQRARASMDRADVFIRALKEGRAVDRQARMAGQSLMEFVAQEGGIADTGGELAAMGANEWHKGKAFRRRIVREGDEGTFGSDYVTERAIAAGYLPEGATGNDLLEAFREELAGRPRFSSMADRNLAAEENEAALQDFEAMLAELGLNAKTDTPEAIKAAIEAASEAPSVTDPDGAIYDQSGALVTDSPAFRAWFGDSKVVGENGEPLVVYHGSPDARFAQGDDAQFAGRSARFGLGPADDDGAFWFAKDRAAARSYADPMRAWDYQNAEPGVVEAYVKIENPLIVDARGAHWRDAQQRGKTSDVIDEARANGHDGVIIRNVSDYYNDSGDGKQSRPTDTFVAFRPEQIKSVFNRGTFDPADPRILFQDGGYPLAPRSEWYGEANYEASGGRLVWMSPQAYLDAVRPLEIDETSRENIDDLKQHIESGRTLDPLKIFAGGKEDGRHRAHAALELGITSVPVVTFGETLFQSDIAPPFYSALAAAVSASQTKRAPADQWKATLAKTPGVKKEEIELLAVNDWLDAQDGPVSREALAEFLEHNGVRIDVIVQGGKPDPRVLEAAVDERLDMYADQEDFSYGFDPSGMPAVEQTDDGWEFDGEQYDSEIEAHQARDDVEQSYRDEYENDRRRDWMDENRAGVEEEVEEELESAAQFGSYTLEGADETYQEFLFRIGVPETADPKLIKKMEAIGRYTTHWKQRGVIGHVRSKDRVAVDGGKVFEAGEFQSDILQAGRDQGFSQPASPEEITAAYEGRFEAQTKVDEAISASEAAVQAGRDLVMPFLGSWQGAEWLVGDANGGRVNSEVADYARSGGFFSTQRARLFETPAEFLAVRLGGNRGDTEVAAVKGLLTDLQKRGLANGVPQETVDAAWQQLGSIIDAQERIRVAALQRDEAHQRFLNASGEGGVPDTPFKTSWAAMLMKRMIRHAVDNGYDKIVWITGEQQNGGSTVGTAGEVAVARWAEDNFSVEPYSGSRTQWALREKLIMLRRPSGLKAKDDKRSDEEKLGPLGERMTAAEIKAIFNTWRDNLGDKMIEAALKAGDGITTDFDASAVGVEDDGHFFYDKALVNITNDIIKRYGAKVERIRVQAGDATTIAYERNQIAELERTEPLSPEDQAAYNVALARYGELAGMDGAGRAENRAEIEEIRRKWIPLNAAANRDVLLSGHRKRLEALVREQPGFDITDQMREAAGRGFTLFQPARGSIQPGDRHLITLMATADKSTFLHEAGHRYLFGLFNDAARNGASEQVQADARAVLAWMNVNDASEVTRELHERWAETFEQYLMEGRAPSVELRSAFQRFAAWLKDIYDGVRRRLPNAAINDDIRGVMDRLLATDAEIAEARTASGVGQGIASAELAGMTPEAFAEYAALANRALDQAQDSLLRETMRAIRREKTAEWKALAAEFRPDIEADVDQMLDLQAMGLLRRTPMSREVAVAMLGNEAGLALLPKGVPPIVTVNGVHPDMIAEAAGYPSGVAMLNGLMEYQAEREQRKAEGMKGSVREARIEERVRDRMLEHYGDPFTDGSIQEEALAAIHNDTQGKVLAAELGILARRSGRAPSPYSILRQWAARHIGSRPVSDAKPQRFLRAERTAAQAAIRALTAKNNAEAFRQKQAQTVNFLLYGEARKAKREVEKAIARMSKLGKRRTMRSLDQDYLDRIHEILGRYDLTDVPATEVRARASLLEFVAERTAAGESINIPNRLIEKAGRQHYSTLTVDEVRELDETIQHLAGLGKLKQKILDGQAERDLAAVVSEAVESASLLRDKPYSEAVSADDKLSRRLARWLPNAEASNVKIQATLRRLDNNARGVWTRVLDVPGQLAANRLAALRETFWAGIIAAERAIPDAVRARWSERLTDHPIINPRTGQPMTELIRQDLIGMAKHVGSMSNFEKFAKGWGYVQKQADEFEVARARLGFIAWLDSQMDPSEWAYVEAWWDAHEQQRDEYFDNERDLTGVRPILVEPEPFAAGGRLFRGGYAPISYDPRFDQAAAIREQEDEADMFGGFTRAPRTSNGAAQDRTGYVGPVNFSMARGGVDAQTQMLRIAYGRYITDALKFLRQPAIREAVRLKQGDAAYDQILAWLGAQVKDGLPPNPASGFMDRLLRGARANFTVSVLLLSSTVLIAQPAGLVASASVLRGKLAKGIGMAAKIAATGDLRAFIFERSDYMRLRVEEGGIDRDIRGAVLNPVSTARPGMIVQPGMTPGQRAEAAAAVATAAKNNATHLGGLLVGLTDFYFVSAPTWLATYDSALAEGATEQEAVLAADANVQRTQGGGRPIDMAGIQRGSEAARMLTFAFGWANAHYNLQRDYALDVRDGRNRAHAMMGMFLLLVAAPLVDALLSNDWPDWEEDESPLTALGGWVLRNVFFGIPAGVPVVRELSNIAERKLQGKYAGSALTTPAGKIIDAALVIGDDLYRGGIDSALIAAGHDVEDKEVSRRWPSHVIMGVGMALGLPGSVQASRVVNYGTDVADGEQKPAHAGDWINGMMRGPQPDQE